MTSRMIYLFCASLCDSVRVIFHMGISTGCLVISGLNIFGKIKLASLCDNDFRFLFVHFFLPIHVWSRRMFYKQFYILCYDSYARSTFNKVLFAFCYGSYPKIAFSAGSHLDFWYSRYVRSSSTSNNYFYLCQDNATHYARTLFQKWAYRHICSTTDLRT